MSISPQEALPAQNVGERWNELARRDQDGLHAKLLILGEIALAETPARAVIRHDSGVKLFREGSLKDVADVYIHPMTYVSSADAERAFPARGQEAA